MLKQLFLTLAILISVTGFISCSKDEPNNGGKDPIENPSDYPVDDQVVVIVNADGTTSSGLPFQRIDETTFMLNYVQYRIISDHLEVIGRDELELISTLKGKVKICPAVAIDGKIYVTTKIGGFRESSLNEILLPYTIVEISDNAFLSARLLKTVNIPGGLFRIGNRAFEGCRALESLKLNEGLKEIGHYAFCACDKLKSINIPENVSLCQTSICTAQFEEIVLPSRFSALMDLYPSFEYLFQVTVKNVYLKGLNATSLDYLIAYLFDHDYAQHVVNLHVPEGSLKSYKEHPFWGKFKHIEEYNPESLSQ